MMSIWSATSSKCFPGGQLLGAKFLQLPDQYGHYLPEAPTLLAALLRDCRILGEAVKLLQVIDCKSPLNGEFLSQLQSYELNIDFQHLWKEMTMTNHVTQSCGDNGFGWPPGNQDQTFSPILPKNTWNFFDAWPFGAIVKVWNVEQFSHVKECGSPCVSFRLIILSVWCLSV